MNLRLAVLISACLATFLAPGGLTQDLRELTRMIKDTDPQERAKAARALGRMQSMDASRLLVRMLADEHPHVHDEAAEALVSMSSDAIFEFLATRALSTARDHRTVAGLAEVCTELKLTAAVPNLARFGRNLRGRWASAAPSLLHALAVLGKDDETARTVVSNALDSAEWIVRTAALEAHTTMLEKEASPALLQALDAREFQVRIAALESLERVDKAAALEQAKKLLSDPHWSVRVTAIRIAERSKDRSVIPLLVEQLGKEDGRLRRDISDALRSLASDDNSGSDDGGSTVMFYGIQIYSKRVIFVVDLSQGMQEKAKGTNKARIAIAQEQYVECLKGYAPDGYFNLVVFATEPSPWQNRMQRGQPTAKSASASWLEKMVQQWIYGRSTGRTNIYDSLALCFTDPNVDTVVLLTDATSITEGTYQTKTDILKNLEYRNRYRKIRFHCIGLGKKDGTKVARNMMEDLAEDTRGQFIETD